MASPQPTDSHTRISNELYTQILMRDFTKRQRAILDLIIRFSYGCGKKEAYIPCLRDFELCGVHQKKASAELRELRKLNVISWDDTTKEYWLDKNYDEWAVPGPDDIQLSRFSEVLRANLTHHQNGGVQTGDDHQNGGDSATKTVVNAPPKQGRFEPEIPSGTWADGVPITKDNYIDKKTVVGEEKRRLINTYSFQLMKAGRDIFYPYEITQKTAYEMAELLAKETLPVELGYEAMKIAKNLDIGKNIQGNEGLARTKLQRWLQSGVKDIERAKEFEDRVYGAGKQTTAASFRNGGTSRGSNHQRNDGNEDWEQIEANFFSQKGT